MCFGDDARPPYPPVSGGAQDRGDVVLTSADGAKVAAHYARSDQPTTTGMVVLPDVRGLHDYYKDLAARFAEAGMHSVAIDYFARTAESANRDESFDFKPHVERLHWDRVADDAGAAVAWLRESAGATSVFTVGFCLGGAMSWRQSAAGHGLNGCIGFYGVPSRVEDAIPSMKSPILILAAGQDFTPVSEVEAFAERVRDAGVAAEMHVYADAPHSFFDRTFDEHAAACDDAWRRILAFVQRNA